MKKIALVFIILLLMASTSLADVLIMGWWDASLDELYNAREHLLLDKDGPVDKVLHSNWKDSSDEVISNALIQIENEIVSKGGSIETISPVLEMTTIPVIAEEEKQERHKQAVDYVKSIKIKMDSETFKADNIEVYVDKTLIGIWNTNDEARAKCAAYYFADLLQCGIKENEEKANDLLNIVISATEINHIWISTKNNIPYYIGFHKADGNKITMMYISHLSVSQSKGIEEYNLKDTQAIVKPELFIEEVSKLYPVIKEEKLKEKLLIFLDYFGKEPMEVIEQRILVDEFPLHNEVKFGMTPREVIEQEQKYGFDMGELDTNYIMFTFDNGNPIPFLNKTTNINGHGKTDLIYGFDKNGELNLMLYQFWKGTYVDIMNDITDKYGLPSEDVEADYYKSLNSLGYQRLMLGLALTKNESLLDLHTWTKHLSDNSSVIIAVLKCASSVMVDYIYIPY